MGYYLGVDMGTTYTAAAVWRERSSEVVGLGIRSAVVPSIVAVGADGSVLVGEAAARRATIDPQRAAREFKRRIGDPTPILVGGSPYSADALTAMMLRWVVDRVTEMEGSAPAAMAVSHPANWGEYKKDLMRQAVVRADVDQQAMLVSEPEAAAIHYASERPVAAGTAVAVYDLGGGTFDAAVLRKTVTGWEILGTPEGVERLGGIDFDEAVYGHVVEALDDAPTRLDPGDRAAQVALAQLRWDCVDAKEALSSDTAVSIPLTLPGLGPREVRLTRSELEDMIRAPLGGTITALTRAVQSAELTPADIDVVLLVGGSSRIPLVGQLVGAAAGRPVAVDAHPKYGVALGAALVAALSDAGETDHPADAQPNLPDGSIASAAVPPDVPTEARPAPVLPAPRRRARPLWLAMTAAAMTAMVAAVIAARDPTRPGTGTTTTTTSTDPPTFTATFTGALGEGDELLDWLEDRLHQTVHLDLTFPSEPISGPVGTTSPELWSVCGEIPPGEAPSPSYCSEGFVLYVLTTGREQPFVVNGFQARLESDLFIDGIAGPNQGIMSVTLEPVPNLSE